LFSFGILLSVVRGTLLFKPSFYQGTSAELCICARSIKSVRNRLNTVRINGNRPQVWLDADTNGAAHASVFHPLIVRRNARPYNRIGEANSRVRPACCWPLMSATMNSLPTLYEFEMTRRSCLVMTQ
jgi:hypothetical protein